MSSEAARLGLYNRLREVPGPEHADTFVNSLVTKADIAELATKADLAGIRADMAELKADLMKVIVWTMVALTGVYSGIVVMVAALS